MGGADAEVVLIGREAGSGTRDGFESATGTKDACQYKQELNSTGGVTEAVKNNPNSIGYTSLAAVNDSVKTLTVNGVAPTEDTVKDGSYKVQRDFVLVTRTGQPLSGVAQAYFDFITSSAAADVITAAGAVPVA
ncbi:Phosphate-binding protein PstS 2 [bioreactor metagenome]|uniref:Phosphate-binding protein PstS 2 n=1 Tax=bioreactor metagenome TaxID=1076179 RepID=A0A645IWI9_9ZZZZ